MTALYSIGTWNSNKQAFTPQRGLSVPPFNITKAQLRIALCELRGMNYSAHRYRDAEGTHHDNDASVWVERTDGKPWREIMKSWKKKRKVAE